MRVLVTGARGFIGAATAARLAALGHMVRGTSRVPPASQPGDPVSEWQQLDLLDPDAVRDTMARCCEGMDAVVHAAAHVHVGAVRSRLQPDRFHRINAQGTAALARAAAEAGVKRFVLVSSISVHGPAPAGGQGGAQHRLREDDEPRPVNPYGRSKLEAEEALRAACAGTPMEMVIVRPPLVFGPGMRGNLLRLLRWLERGLPVPVAVHPVHRSFVYVDSLADLLALCTVSPAAAGRVYLAADHDYEIAELVTELGRLLGRPARLWRLPEAWLRGGLARGPLARLTQPFLLDSSRARAELGWKPLLDPGAALRHTVTWYFQRRPESGT